MKNICLLMAAALSLSMIDAHALTPQQEKMGACNAQATQKKLKGADRKAFMQQCLSSQPGAGGSELTPQQQKMKSCNADATAKGLKGPERKAFMSGCLGSAPAKATGSPAPAISSPPAVPAPPPAPAR